MLKTPNATRWNSTFDALRGLLEHKAKLNDIMDACNLRRFTPQEIGFMEEYIILMEPLAITLDKLQGDHASLGMVLPAITKLKQFWESKIAEGSLQYCQVMAEFLLWDLNKRTEEFFDDKDYILGKTNLV